MSATKKVYPALFYDSECTLCVRFKQALERIPGGQELTMISIRDEETFKLYPELDIKEAHDTIHLIDEDDKIYKGGEVVTYLAHRFPGVKKFAWLLETGVGKKTVDLFYNAVNQYRKSSLNNCKSCKQ